jgi:hypothetical protein
LITTSHRTLQKARKSKILYNGLNCPGLHGYTENAFL